MARPQRTTSRARSGAHPAATMALTDTPRGNHRLLVRTPFATPAKPADELPTFLSTTSALPHGTTHPDRRERPTSTLSPRGPCRWEPLTFVHQERK
jgi:hypothetical protein